MFWTGLIIAVIGGIFKTNYINKKIQKIYPIFHDFFCDTIFIFFVIIGAYFSINDFYLKIEENEKIISKFDYYEISNYNAAGNKSIKINGISSVKTPINDWAINFMTRKEGMPTWIPSQDLLLASKETIKKMPFFPFAHYTLALCLYKNKNKEWIESAQKAHEIFQNTTKIPNHHIDHDYGLKVTEQLLNQSITN